MQPLDLLSGVNKLAKNLYLWGRPITLSSKMYAIKKYAFSVRSWAVIVIAWYSGSKELFYIFAQEWDDWETEGSKYMNTEKLIAWDRANEQRGQKLKIS